MKNLDLNTIANQLVTENLTKKNRKLSINNRLVEVLKNQKPKLRLNVVTEIAILRLKEADANFDENEFAKLLQAKDDKAEKMFKKVWTTCKNGVDTSLADGNTNSNFSYNPMFNTKYKIVKHSDGTLEMINL